MKFAPDVLSTFKVFCDGDSSMWDNIKEKIFWVQFGMQRDFRLENPVTGEGGLQS